MYAQSSLRSPTQEKLYPKNWVQLLLEKSYLGMTSPEEIVLMMKILGYSSLGEIVPTKSWVQLLLVKNFVIFSHKILGTTSLKKKTL